MVSQSGQDYLFKFLLIGDASTGKSQLLNRFSDETFNNEYLSTIGVDFKIKIIQVKNKNVKLQIWDTAGQERFKTITNSYYKGSHAIIIVFDVTDKDSFNNLPKYFEEVQKFSTDNVKLFIVGNKSDLLSSRTVQYSEAKSFAESKNLLYFETSAKTGEGISNVFESASQILINSQEGNDTQPQQSGGAVDAQTGKSDSIYKNLY